MKQHAGSRTSAAPRHALTVLAAMLVAIGAPVGAADLNPGGEWQIRWDNTIKYSAGYRTDSPSAALISGAAKVNNDDGDRNFSKGLISNRADLLSEFDVQKDGFGLRLSAAAWYDTVYNSGTSNTSKATSNNVSAPYNAFSPTRGASAGAMRKCSTGSSSAGTSWATPPCPIAWASIR